MMEIVTRMLRTDFKIDPFVNGYSSKIGKMGFCSDLLLQKMHL